MELVAGQAQQVDVLRLHVDGQVSRRLHGVGVEQDALLPAQRTDLLDGLDRADLVVGVHDGDQRGVRPYGRRQLVQPDKAVLVDG